MCVVPQAYHLEPTMQTQYSYFDCELVFEGVKRQTKAFLQGEGHVQWFPTVSHSLEIICFLDVRDDSDGYSDRILGWPASSLPISS